MLINRSSSGVPRRGVLRSFVAGSLLMPGILQELLAGEAGSGAASPADPLAPVRRTFPPEPRASSSCS